MSEGHEFWQDLIRSLFAKSGLSEHELSRRSGVARGTIRRVLHEVPHKIGIDIIERLLAVFSYDLDAIQPKTRECGR